MTFAIVIPNLNQSHFLSTAFESLIHQDVKFNLAVMDGGSIDNFYDVVSGYSKMITFVRSYKDNGQSASIREGKEKIQGEILSWLNADDYLFPNALDKVSNIFDNYPDVDVVYGDAIHVNADGFFQCYFPPIQKFNANELVKNCFICQPACFYRRTAYEKVGGLNPNLNYTMDWDLWCRFAEIQAKFYYLKEPLAVVRYYKGTKTRSGSIKRYKEIYRIERKYGNRWLRSSVAGAFCYDLMIKEKKTRIDQLIISLFDLIRKTKNIYSIRKSGKATDQELIYGFHRWSPKVEGKGRIHIPWYNHREWKSIILHVYPIGVDYKVFFNGMECKSTWGKNNRMHINIPEVPSPYRVIEIECTKFSSWELIQFDAIY